MRKGGQATIFVKLAGCIAIIQLVAIGSVAGWLTWRDAQSTRRGLERKAETYGRLVSEQVKSAIAFDDQETARETFDALAADRDIDALALYTENSNLLYGRGDTAPTHPGGIPEALTLESNKDAVLVVVPVKSLEGPKGTLVVRLSTAAVRAALAERVKGSLAAAAIALLTSLAAAAWVARRLAKRIGAIASAADRVAQGELDQPALSDESGDELGILARGFDTMLARLRALMDETVKNAEREQERLEALVRARTAALESRNVDLRRILDNVQQGLVVIDREGCLRGGGSAILERWLGPAPQSVWPYISAEDPLQVACLESSWEAVLEDVLPRELALAQMPTRIVARGYTFELAVSLITDEADAITGALLVLSDISAAVAREAAESEERETLRMVGRLLSDRDGIIELMAEGAGLMATILERSTDRAALLRALHTLKGITAQFGVESISSLCHDLEGRLAESNGGLTASEGALVETRWAALSNKLSTVLGTRDADEIRVDRREYEALKAALVDPQMRATVATWRHERVAPRLERYAASARALAARLDQPTPEVTVSAQGVRVPPGQMSTFWPAFTHLIRNAVDHGCRPGEAAQLELVATRDPSGLSIAVRDHGPGVAWATIAERARNLGLPADTHDDLVAALFSDGLSSRDSVSDISGRGVGLAAVYAAAVESGGSVHVHSRSDGTTFEVRWPTAALWSIAPPRRPSLALSSRSTIPGAQP